MELSSFTTAVKDEGIKEHNVHKLNKKIPASKKNQTVEDWRKVIWSDKSCLVQFETRNQKVL